MSKVLLVEDDNNLREIYEARLAAEGYEIITAQNGEEALVVAKQNKPDLIISDVMMPRISGFEMLDILRNTDTLRETKVILLTALGQAEDQQRAGKLGADKYLVKSQVTLEDIVNTAKELLGEVSAMAPESVFTKDSAPAAQAAAPVAAPVEQPVVPEPVAEAPAAPVAPQEAAPAPVATPVAAPVAVEDTDPIIPVVPELPVQPAPAPAPAVDSPAMPVMPQQVTPAPAPVVAPVAAPVAVADPDPITPEVVAPQANDLSASVSPAAPSAPAPNTDAAQTTAAEEATVENQIENFAASAEPVSPVEAPAAAVAAPAAPATSTAANEEVLASVVDELTAATNAPAAEVLPPSQRQVPGSQETPEAKAPVTPAHVPTPTPIAEPELTPTPSSEPVVFSPDLASTNDSDIQTVAGKKVIQPINDISSPGQNLEELLAKEEAKEQLGGTQAVVGGAAPVASPSSTSVDPNSIAL